MRRWFVLAGLCVFAISAFASERGDRAQAEWQKYENNAMNVCFGNGSLYLTYSPLDRKEWNPVQFSKNLQPDVVKRAAAIVNVKDATARQTIENEVNAAVNQHLDELHNGTYNKIEVNLPHAPRFVITPAENESDQVLVWVAEGAGGRALSVLAHMTPEDSLSLMTPDGTKESVNKKNRPKWLTTEDLTVATEDAGVHAGRAHAAHFTKCK